MTRRLTKRFYQQSERCPRTGQCFGRRLSLKTARQWAHEERMRGFRVLLQRAYSGGGELWNVLYVEKGETI